MSLEKDLYKLFNRSYSPNKIRKLMEKYPCINSIEITIKWKRKIEASNIEQT